MKRSLISFGQRARNVRGFTILLAALVSAIVLAIGSSIFAIAQKQIILSSIGRDSQFAFYAADTAVECALYWDVRRHRFDEAGADIDDITCDGAEPIDSDSGTSAGDVHWFQYDISLSSGSACATVRITKDMTENDLSTLVRSDGHNVACDKVDSSGRVLERSIELRY